MAVATLADYEGLDIKTILNSKLSQLTSIRQVPTAAYHRAGIFQAIQNAAAEAEQLLPKPGTHSEKSSSSESANSKDRGLQSNPKRIEDDTLQYCLGQGQKAALSMES